MQRQPRQIVLAREAPFGLAGTAVRPASLEVIYGGNVVSLEPRVTKVLVALHRSEGQPVSRDELIDLCWGGRVVTEGALNRCVAQLRKALDADARIRIETIPTVGYRLVVMPAVQVEAGRSRDAGSREDPDARSDSASQFERPAPPRVRMSNPTGWLLAAGSVAVLLAIVSISAWWAISLRPARWAAVGFHPLTSTPDLESFPAISPGGEQIVYSMRPDAYGPRDLYLRNVDQGTPVHLTSGGNDDYGAAWSPLGNRIAFVRSYDEGPCNLIVVPMPLGAERVVARCQTATQTRLSWLDEHTLVFADQPRQGELSRIRAVDVGTGVGRDLTSPPLSTLGDAEPQASPDGRYVVFRRTLTFGADDLMLLDVRSGQEQALVTDGWKAAGYVWSADSRNVFFSSNRGGDFGLWSVDLRVTESQRWVTLGLGTVSFSRMSSDRQNRLAVELTRSHTNLARVLPSGEIQPVTLGAGADFDPAAAPDGTVAHVSNRGGSYEIWIATLGGQSVRLTSILGSYVSGPTWSPDGQTVAFVAVKSRKAEIYTISRDGSRLRQVTNDGAHKKDPVYDASGERLFYVERTEGKWHLMQMALGNTDASAPQSVPGGEGWSTLHAGPDGSIFGQRQGEDRIRALDPTVLASSGVRFADNYLQDGPRIADIDVWTVGMQGIYIRRGRRVHQPSSIWSYPWNQAGRKLTDAPLAAGDVGIDRSGNVIFSQTLDLEVDLGLIELRGRR
jgi:Tol biopolymer transport system component/DNA-binding winged helix-turn-helix (wHTH) protein